jgi:hypothetical protein
MCWDFDAAFTADLSAPAAARTAVAAALMTRFKIDTAEPIVNDARLVISELVTAAVRSGASSVEVTAHVHHGELWLEVLRVAGSEVRGETAPVGELGAGRGETLIAALATIKGETHATRGTVVWTMLETAATFTNSMSCELAPRSPILAFAS